MSALPNRQRAAASAIIPAIMQHPLQQLDLDYYRYALLLVARAELERLRQERLSETQCSVVYAANGAGSGHLPNRGLPYGSPGAVRC